MGEPPTGRTNLVYQMEVIVTNKNVENWVRNLEFIARDAVNNRPKFRKKKAMLDTFLKFSKKTKKEQNNDK